MMSKYLEGLQRRAERNAKEAREEPDYSKGKKRLLDDSTAYLKPTPVKRESTAGRNQEAARSALEEIRGKL